MNRGMLRLVGRFVLLFIVTVGALAGLWRFITPAYTWIASELAGPLFRGVESPDVTVVEAHGDELWVLREVGDGRIAPFTWFDRYVFFAVIPLTALLAATPGLGWRRRIVRALIGWIALLGVHVAYVVASVELSYMAIGLRPVGPQLARTLDAWQMLVRVLWEAAPIAIWIGLTWGAWRRQLARLRSNAPHAEALRDGNRTLFGWGWRQKEGTS